jgi:hypothetical protein
LIFFKIVLGLSRTRIELASTDADILDPGP